MKKLLFLLVFMFFPISAYATATTLTCTDFPSTAGSPTITCSAGALTVSSGTGVIYDATHGLKYTNGATYYVSYIVSGGSGTGKMYMEGDVADGAQVSVTTTAVAQAVVVGVGNVTRNDLAFKSNSSFAGTISAICITDIAGQCEPAVASGVATSSIDQTQRNVWQAYWIFFAMLVFVVWLGRSQGQ